jgi:Ca-activated chloride channel family protein
VSRGGPLLLATLLCATARVEAFSWEDLWLRPDQQGERALQAGHPAEAATRFSDPRRRAFAEIEAGHFAAAAQGLAPLSDPDSEYNRGNALARQGELKGALAAYDAALAQAPADSPLGRDARHNRELVARQLPPSAKQQGGGNASGGEASQGGQNPGAQNASAQNPATGNANAHNNSGMNQGAQASSNAGDSGLGQANSGPGSGGTSGDRDDARASQAASAARLAGGPGDAAASRGSQDAGVKASAADGRRERAPASEQAMARDQWLRQIPDDPGGLLRRKFLIEHLILERAAERGDAP